MDCWENDSRGLVKGIVIGYKETIIVSAVNNTSPCHFENVITNQTVDGQMDKMDGGSYTTSFAPHPQCVRRGTHIETWASQYEQSSSVGQVGSRWHSLTYSLSPICFFSQTVKPASTLSQAGFFLSASGHVSLNMNTMAFSIVTKLLMYITMIKYFPLKW